MKPVYVDGPLLGERFDTDVPFVQAVEPGEGKFPSYDRTVTYQFRHVGFAAGTKAVMVWIGWCGDSEPDAGVICRALFRDDVMERAETVTVPAPDTTAPGLDAPDTDAMSVSFHEDQYPGG